MVGTRVRSRNVLTSSYPVLAMCVADHSKEQVARPQTLVLKSSGACGAQWAALGYMLRPHGHTLLPSVLRTVVSPIAYMYDLTI